jgi:hypothetical protein
MRIVMYTLGAVGVLVASSLAVFCFYSTVVPSKSLQELHLSEFDDGHLTVAVDGRLLGGMMAIHSAKQYQRGSGIVLVVRAGITRAGLRNVRFHYEIKVPSNVDEISFGNAEDVIWRRKR